ncbi:BTB/POZ domain-containing protein [Ditylenchus destructor]|nr:BTB/POZ domain-containing protein [Ditylenchus destructor]
MSGSNATSDDGWVRLNVGGKIFETTKVTLLQIPDTFFGRLLEGGLQSKKDETGAFRIDRSYEHFDTILNYLRDGSVNFDRSEKFMKDLLREADYYSIAPLVDEIREAMGFKTVSNRSEMVILTRNTNRINIDQDVISYIGLLTVSEKSENYEVLQALRQKVDIKTKNLDGRNMHYLINHDDDWMNVDTWMNVELVLRDFGFVQESNDNTYDHLIASKSTKFIRTVRQ